MVDITLDRRSISDQFKIAERRLIVVEYDGILVPRRRQSGVTIPTSETKAAVALLSGNRRNTFILLSSRDQSHLDLHWSSLDAVLVAENGATYRELRRPWQTLFHIDDGWMERAGKAMEALPFEYSGSFLERRKHSIVWHFPPPIDVANDLPLILAAIRALPDYGSFEIYQSTHHLELGPKGVDAGSFLARWIGARRFDLVIAVAGDKTGQTLFPVLTHEAVTVSVSPAMTSAGRYWLKSQQEVIALLKSLQAAG